MNNNDVANFIQRLNLNGMIVRKSYDKFSKNNNFVCNPHNINLFELKRKDKRMNVPGNESTMEQFECKKRFDMISTEAINTTYIFSKTSEKSGKLQDLVLNTINKIIDEYIKLNPIFENQIIFIYKGGSQLRRIFDSYSGKIVGDSRFDFLLRFFQRNSRWFNKGDADYSVLINPNLNPEQFNKAYCDINVLIYFGLLYIRDSIENDLEYYLGPNSGLTDHQLKEMLRKMNKIADHQHKLEKCGKYSRIINISHLSYFDHNVKLNESIDNPNINMDPKRVDFAIHKDTEGNSYFRPLGYNKKNIFYSINDTNKFGNSHFCLQRLKINLKARCEIEKNPIKYDIAERNFTLGNTNPEAQSLSSSFEHIEEREYTLENFPSELVDISIPKQDDHDLHLIYSDLYLFIEKVNLSIYKENYEHKINFNSYSLYGFFVDICVALFSTKLWEAPKVEKRIPRFLILVVLMCFNSDRTNLDRFNYLFNEFKNIIIYNIEVIDGQPQIQGLIDKINTYKNYLRHTIKDVNFANAIVHFEALYIPYINSLTTQNLNSHKNIIRKIDDELSSVKTYDDSDFYVLDDFNFYDEWDYMAQDDDEILFGGNKISYKSKYLKYIHKSKKNEK